MGLTLLEYTDDIAQTTANNCSLVTLIVQLEGHSTEDLESQMRHVAMGLAPSFVPRHDFSVASPAELPRRAETALGLRHHLKRPEFTEDEVPKEHQNDLSRPNIVWRYTVFR